MWFKRDKSAVSGVQWLIAGLGNPGAQYENTRHNVGFAAVDALAAGLGVKINRLKFQSLYTLAEIGGVKVMLLKPQTFMNRSGQAVRDAAQFFKLPPDRVLILFDDVSLPPGRLRIRRSGSAGGHNGIKDIIYQLSSDQMPRVKIGVGSPPHEGYDLADWVLSGFSAEERALVAPSVRLAAEAASEIITKGVDEAMNRYNG